MANTTDKPEHGDKPDVNSSRGLFGRNPYYDPKLYKEISELSGNQIVDRIQHCDSQIKVLGEAAEFETDRTNENLLCEAVSSFKAEQDSLEHHLRRKLVDEDLRRAKENVRQFQDEWARRHSKPEWHKRAMRGPKDLQPETHQKKNPRQSEPTHESVWDGVERRRDQCPASDLRNRRPTNRRSKGLARTIHLSFNI